MLAGGPVCQLRECWPALGVPVERMVAGAWCAAGVLLVCCWCAAGVLVRSVNKNGRPLV